MGNKTKEILFKISALSMETFKLFSEGVAHYMKLNTNCQIFHKDKFISNIKIKILIQTSVASNRNIIEQMVMTNVKSRYSNSKLRLTSGALEGQAVAAPRGTRRVTMTVV